MIAMEYQIDPIPPELAPFTVRAGSVEEAALIAGRHLYGARINRVAALSGHRNRPGTFAAYENLRSYGAPFRVDAGRVAVRARAADLTPRCARCNTPMPAGVKRRYKDGRPYCLGCV